MQVKAWRGDAACTLRDLCAEDKRKVAKLIRQVVEAEQRVQALTAQAQEVNFWLRVQRRPTCAVSPVTACGAKYKLVSLAAGL